MISALTRPPEGQTFYKVLDRKGRCHYSGREIWSLPSKGKLGRWVRPIKDLCILRFEERGYQVLRKDQLVLRLGPVIWQVEVRGEILQAMDVCLVEQGRLVARVTRWNGLTARLFAADCAEHVLPIIEKAEPTERRIRAAIAASKDFALRRIGRAQLLRAAQDAREVVAAMDPTTSGGMYAAPTADRHVIAAICAVYAASLNALEAANQAAHAAARTREFEWEASDPKNPERMWQTERLFGYLKGELGS